MDIERMNTIIKFADEEMDGLKIAHWAVNELYDSLSGDELVAFEEKYDIDLDELNRALSELTRLAILYDHELEF